ncbi:MOSC N-terminal beta barrel domain-containing protein [Hydrogenophaga sp. 5NK40-0174]|uniref:MOSC domain-containing protein n=1 Tax=Hydrogenophaga sp. 5NK40-0174 TaxID=3127649 RepID=UPI0031088128
MAISDSSSAFSPVSGWDDRPRGRVSGLWIYPVKSCAGVSMEAALLTLTGLAHDREWMVVDAQGRFVTQRELAAMALIRPSLNEVALVLTDAAGRQAPLHISLSPDGERLCRRVQVWHDHCDAWDEGEDAAHWLQGVLGQAGLRLVRFPAGQRRVCGMEWTAGVEYPVMFADGFGILVVGQASVDHLNEHLERQGQSAVSIRRFRPNVVLSGMEAHDEDRMGNWRVMLGGGDEAAFACVKPCARCPIPDVDPDTGERGHHVGDAIRRYRADRRLNGAITFGMNVVVNSGAGQTLRVGDAFEGDWVFD